jgi:hypothetical protein
MGDYNRRDMYERRKTAMDIEWRSFESQYVELAQFVTPRKGRWFVSDRNKGDKRFNKIINGKATNAHRKARAGLLAGVMSPTRPWHARGTLDPDLNKYKPVKEWLYKVETLDRAILNSSNFYQMSANMIGELLLFATGCMLHVDDFDDVARFYTQTTGSFRIAQNERYDVDTLCRHYEATVSQIVGQFGLKNCSQYVKDAYDKGNYDAWYPVTHFVSPNDDYDENKKQGKFKKFRSCYYEAGNNDKDKFLSEGGFNRFPAYCPRWDVAGEDIYGTSCPGMEALGDIKGLQTQEKRKAQGIDKMVSPPMQGPATLRNKPVSSLPGGLNLFDQSGDGKEMGLRPLYMVNPQLQELRVDMAAGEHRIDEAFYVDLFMAISNMEGIQPKNQFELSERRGEALLQLGPVLERMHGEFLEHLLDNILDQEIAAGILPPPPPEIQGKELETTYISSLAMAQRSVATTGIERVATYTAGLAKAGWPEALEKFDAQKSVDEYASVTGIPPSVIRSEEEVAERLAAKQRQMQMQQAAEMAKTVAPALAAASGPVDPTSVLKNVSSAMVQNRREPQ